MARKRPMVAGGFFVIQNVSLLPFRSGRPGSVLALGRSVRSGQACGVSSGVTAVRFADSSRPFDVQTIECLPASAWWACIQSSGMLRHHYFPLVTPRCLLISGADLPKATVSPFIDTNTILTGDGIAIGRS